MIVEEGGKEKTYEMWYIYSTPGLDLQASSVQRFRDR
jgi:hypothetical protein